MSDSLGELCITHTVRDRVCGGFQRTSNKTRAHFIPRHGCTTVIREFTMCTPAASAEIAHAAIHASHTTWRTLHNFLQKFQVSTAP